MLLLLSPAQVLDGATGKQVEKTVCAYVSGYFSLGSEMQWIGFGVFLGIPVFFRVMIMLGLQFVCHLKR